MKISNIFQEMSITDSIDIINEKQFDIFAPSSSQIHREKCIFIEDAKFIKTISDSVKMIITTSELAGSVDLENFGVCIVDNPKWIFFQLHNFMSEHEEYIVKPKASIFGSGCNISPLAYVADTNVIIGNNVIIEEFVSIKSNTIIEDNVIIRSGTIVGGQGFEFKRNNKDILAVKHVGSVKICEGVEIQQNSCIDRAIFPWDATVIGCNTKIDNLVHIAHAVKIGERNMIVAQALIAGRVVTGNNVWIGPGTIISNGLHIGDDARVNIGAVVTKSVSDFESVTGNFAISHDIFIKNLKETINTSSKQELMGA